MEKVQRKKIISVNHEPSSEIFRFALRQPTHVQRNIEAPSRNHFLSMICDITFCYIVVDLQAAVNYIKPFEFR